MGLDITAYEKIEVLDPQPYQNKEVDWDEAYDNGWELPYMKDDFFQSYRGLEEKWYSTDSGRVFRFRAGSYSGYNYFREQLCLAAYNVNPEEVWSNPDRYKDKPFFELINFSDCKGSIGPEACSDLAEDFQTWRDGVRGELEKQDGRLGYYAEKYDDWHTAFKLAAGTGMVDFH